MLHLSQVDRRITARAVGELHREAEDGKFASNVTQAGHHVALARHRDHGAGPALPDDPPRQLAARRHEDRHFVAPRDLQHTVECLL